MVNIRQMCHMYTCHCGNRFVLSRTTTFSPAKRGFNSREVRSFAAPDQILSLVKQGGVNVYCTVRYVFDWFETCKTCCVLKLIQSCECICRATDAAVVSENEAFHVGLLVGFLGRLLIGILHDRLVDRLIKCSV